MHIETIGDVVKWSGEFHHKLAGFIEESVAPSSDERVKMLSHYIADHERELAKTVSAFDHVESDNALATWCMEFLSQQSLPDISCKDERWSGMTAPQLMDEVREIHEHLIALYAHLLNRCVATPAAGMLEQLVDLQEHQLMLMTHSANRLEDL